MVAPGAVGDGRARRRRAVAVGRRRPAVADRLRGDAPRTAHDAGRARDGDATLVVPRLEAPRVVERPDAVPHRARGRRPRIRWRSWPASCGRPPPGRHRRPHLGAVSPRSAARPCPDRRSARRATSPARCAPSRTQRRSMRCGGPRPPPIGSAAELQRGAIPLAGRTRGRGLGRSRSTAPGRGPRPGELRHRRRRTERGQPAPRAGRADHRGGRGRAVRLRRHDARRGRYCSDITRCVARRRAAGGVRASCTRCCSDAQEAGVRGGDGRHVV